MLTKTLFKFIKSMLRLADKAKHQTVWAEHNNAQTSPFLVYITLNPERAQRAKLALKDNNCLCNTPLGDIKL
jgi:hypothetical protein